MSFTYGLNLTGSRKKTVAAVTKQKPRNVFGGDQGSDNDESYFDEPEDANKSAQARVNRELQSDHSRRQQKTEPEDDPSIYAYDEVYDAMKEAEQGRHASRREPAKDRKPRYMEGLMRAAEMRKKDLLRAEERKIQREREAEGNTFADKERFVTSAYKQQQEEMSKYEEEVKRREAAEKARGQGDVTSFYRNLIENTMSSASRQAALDVSLNATKGDLPTNTAASREDEPTADVKQQQSASVDSAVRRNADNLVIDKRDLLSSGLNVSRKSRSVRQDVVTQRARDVEAAERTRERQERERQEAEARRQRRLEQERRQRQQEQMEAQLREREAEKVAKRAAEEEALAQKLARHTSTEQVSDARARYLARKREAELRRQAESDD